MQATAVAGAKPGGGLLAPAPPDADSSRGCGLAIDRIHRTVVTADFSAGAGVRPEPVERQQDVVLGVISALARTAVMVALASLAILVLLPAAIAAQAASI